MTDNTIKLKLQRLFSIALVMVLLSLFFGCCFFPRPWTDEPRQENAVMSPLEGESNQRSETAPAAKEASVESFEHRHSTMPMTVHGENSWHWWMGGAMVVMMTLMIF